jgi:hypothetical protein
MAGPEDLFKVDDPNNPPGENADKTPPVKERSMQTWRLSPSRDMRQMPILTRYSGRTSSTGRN